MGWDLIVGQTRHGRGVFATRRYETGDEVETCPTLQVPEEEITGLLSDYVFKSVDDDHVLVLLGYGSLYNHSSEPNLEYVQDDPQSVTFLAPRTSTRSSSERSATPRSPTSTCTTAGSCGASCSPA